MSTDLAIAPAPAVLPAKLFAPTDKAAKRVIEFFTAQINNDNTRVAYMHDTKRFADWCDRNGIRELVDVEPIPRRRLRQGAAGRSSRRRRSSSTWRRSGCCSTGW